VIPPTTFLFASEMVGAVKGVDPETGFNYDDTKRYIDAIDWVSKADKEKIFHGNVKRCTALRKDREALRLGRGREWRAPNGLSLSGDIGHVKKYQSDQNSSAGPAGMREILPQIRCRYAR